MALTEADLDRTCLLCGNLLRAHATLAEGAWFIRPCNARLRANDEAAWDQMVLEDGETCRWCCQLMRVHFEIGEFSTLIRLGKATAEARPTAPVSGAIVPLMVLRFFDCRTPEQRAWVPPS